MLDLSPDNLKTLLGGGGVLGVIGLAVRWWRGRAKVKGSFVKEHYDLARKPFALLSVTIELENVGREATSVGRDVKLVYLTARSQKCRTTLQVEGLNRTLPPVTPRTFVLKGEVPADYVFSHFRIFNVELTRGRSVRIRVLNASGQIAGPVRFLFLKVLFGLFGALPHVKA